MTPPQYATNDPYLASFVLSQGGVITSCRRLGPKRVEFCFETNRELHEKLRIYWSRLPVFVVPYHLYGALRLLKSRTLMLPGGDATPTSLQQREGAPETPTPGPAESSVSVNPLTSPC